MKPRPIAIMIVCTILLAAAQYLWKLGVPNLEATVAGILQWTIIIGFVLSGIASLGMTFAMKEADLSYIYPIIAISYIWTALIAYFAFGERFTFLTIIGTIVIVIGVALLASGDGVTT